MEEKIVIRNLSMVFPGPPEVKALDNIDMRITTNEFISVIGPSGCGKTTLLRLIAGFSKPTSGEIICDGDQVRGPSSRRVVVFQKDAVFPWMTVQQNIEFGLLAKGKDKNIRKQTASHFIDLVGLKSFENNLPKTLSGGMRKRVDLARAYAANPEVMLMDEPFGSLDAQTKSKMQMELLNIWNQETRTVVFITHDLTEAVYLSDRVVVLTERPGRIRKIVDIPLARPRKDEVKFTNQFAEIEKEIWEQVK
jgi:NitT/TauT family transport system ATP-binding protein